MARSEAATCANLASERQWVASLNLTTREKLIIGSADMRQSCCQPSSYYQQSTL